MARGAKEWRRISDQTVATRMSQPLSQSNDMAEPNLNQYRGYLRALAQIELGRRLQGKVDPSDIVQQSLLEAHQDLAALKGKTEAELVAWLRTILTRNLLNVA